jgi:hypothetical protein
MEFEAVTLSDNSSLRYSLSFHHPKKGEFYSRFLAVHVEGEYRIGSGGAPDAYFICGIVQAAVEIWHPDALILDFRKLRYQWDDEMDLLLGAPEVDGILPFAVVVGDACLPAVSTLIYGVGTSRIATEHEGIFDDFARAVTYLEEKLAPQREKLRERIALYQPKKRWGFLGWLRKSKNA